MFSILAATKYLVLPGNPFTKNEVIFKIFPEKKKHFVFLIIKLFKL